MPEALLSWLFPCCPQCIPPPARRALLVSFHSYTSCIGMCMAAHLVLPPACPPADLSTCCPLCACSPGWSFAVPAFFLRLPWCFLECTLWTFIL